MEFRTSNVKVVIDGDGLYTFYSKGNEVKEILTPEQTKGSRLYNIEFPLNTKDNKIVYGMYYFYGRINNQPMIYQAFRGSYLSRWILTNIIPSTVQMIMQDEVGKLSYDTFLTKNNNPASIIKQKAYQNIYPMLQGAHIQPVTMTILVYAQ